MIKSPDAIMIQRNWHGWALDLPTTGELDGLVNRATEHFVGGGRVAGDLPRNNLYKTVLIIGYWNRPGSRWCE